MRARPKVLFADYIADLGTSDSQPHGSEKNCSSLPQLYYQEARSSDVIELRRNFSTPPSNVVASCLLPQYQIYTWVLAMVCLASFLKLNYMIKSVILLVMVIVYTTLMVAAFPEVFDEIQVRPE